MWALRVAGTVLGVLLMFGTLYLMALWIGQGRCYVCGRKVLPWDAYCRYHAA